MQTDDPGIAEPSTADLGIAEPANAQPDLLEAANYQEANVPPYTLPDPLLAGDGTPVRDAQAWPARRQELLRLFEQNVYGRTPSLPRGASSFLRSVDRRALGDRATRKQVTIPLSVHADGPRMELLLYLPNNPPGPHPLFLGLNFHGNHAVHPDPDILLPDAWVPNDPRLGVTEHRATEAGRGADAESWPIARALERGYAVATLYCGDLDPDFDDGFRNGVHGLGGPAGERAGDTWGGVGAWAWGLSRAMDVLEEDPEVAAARVAVLGHSRLGKAALWAGAQDPRFAMVISNNSGCAGASLARRRFGETIARITAQFPHWFCENYKGYGGQEDRLPVDQHELIALIAPRPVYIASAAEDLWADPRGEFLAARAASPVYQLLGTSGLAAEELPPIDQPVRSTIGYHLRPGKHAINAADWERFFDFADIVL